MTVGAGWLGPAGCVASADGFWVGTEVDVDAARAASGRSVRTARGTVLLNIVVGDEVLCAQNGKNRELRCCVPKLPKMYRL